MASFSSMDPAPDDVVISGIGGTFPKSDNLDEFQMNLLSNTDLVEDILDANWQRDKLGVPCKSGAIRNKNKFDTAFFGISQAQTLKMDPMTWRILENTFEAIIDSGLKPSDLRNTNTAVIMGSCNSESESLWILFGVTDAGFSVMGHNRAMVANRVSYWLNTTGTSYSYYAEETGGIKGLEIARELIKTRQCDAAIVGTISLSALPEASFSHLSLGCLSNDGKCRSFDVKGSGYARSEACVVMHLQRAENAKRIYATVVHAQTAWYGERDAGIVRPVSDHVVQFLQSFYEKSGIDPTHIDYLEASGCALKVYEEAEFKAVSKALLSRRKSPLLIGSVKSNIGHTGAASSLCSVVKAVIAMEQGVIPANLHYETPGPHIPALVEGRLKVVSENTAWTPGLTAVSSLDMTGACGHVVLRPCARTKPPAGGLGDELPRLVCLSGRNQESMKESIDKINVKASDAELIRLVQDVYSSNITNHNYRGYFFTSSKEDANEIKYFDGSKRPVWFVFSGMGSQWAGMATHLMRLPVIARTLHECHRILQPKGLDLINILTSQDPAVFDNILHSFVGIAAVQLALVDTLRLLNIEPDGIIGHSVGELGCAYADGCFTMEQMILAAYYRGLASLETELIEGRMAAVGLGYKKIKSIVPPSIDVACHNSIDSSTISGPAEAVTQFVNQLQTQLVFAREVNVSNIAYHSRYIKPAAPKLLAYLKTVIPEPKQRSPRWLSTSAPEELWSTDEARYSSAQYHTNNLLNPVLFEETSKHIPKNAILIEIAPHGLLQAILKRSMAADCINVPLTQRGNQKGLEFLLSAVGKLYLAGVVPRVSALYPPVQFPVSRGTPSLAPLATWDHSKTWRLTSEIKVDEKKASKRNFTLTLNDESYRMLKDYVVEGQIIMPAAAIVVLLWRNLGDMISRNYSKMPVMFEGVHFDYLPMFPKNGCLDIRVFLQRASGCFEIFEEGKGQILVRGQVRIIEDAAAEFSSETEFDSEDGESLTSHDVYSELEYRGFEYGEKFRRIRSATVCKKGCSAVIDWSDDWVVSIDSLLQLAVLQSTANKQQLLAPMFFRKLVIDPLAENRKKSTKEIVAQFHNFTKTVRCGSIEVRGIETREMQLERPLDVAVRKTSFVPFKKSKIQNAQQFIKRAIRTSLENKYGHSRSRVTLTILVDDKTTKHPDPSAASIFTEMNNFKVLLKHLSVSEDLNTSDITPGSIVLASEDTLERGVMLLRNNSIFLLASISAGKDVALPDDVAVIDEQCFQETKWMLVKKCVAVSSNTTVVHLPKLEFLTPRDVFDEISTKQYVLEEISSLAEVKRFYSDIRAGRILTSRSCRFVFVVDREAPPFSPTDNFYAEQLSLDLAVNIYYKGAWGSLVDLQESISPVAASTSVGKLVSSLRVNSIDWSYAGLNIKYKKTEIMEHIRISALDLTGFSSTGQQVMCVAGLSSKCVQSTLEPHLTWPVPQSWSMEDAATVPFAYCLAYYALVLRADARPGESILVQAGHTPVGQAFISVALERGLAVSATVPSQHRRLLRSKFPQILEEDIFVLEGNSLEADILKRSKHDGFRIVVNSLEERYLQISVNCVCLFGRLIQLCTREMEQHKQFGMEPFLKNLGFIAVVPENLFAMRPAWKTRLHEMVAGGIKSGFVRPLDREVFPVARADESIRNLDEANCRNKLLVTRKSQDKTSSNLMSKNSHPRTFLSSECKASCLIVGDVPENCLVLAEWLVDRGCRYVTMCCDDSAMSGFANRHVRTLREHSDASIDIVSTKKTHTLEHTLDLVHGINTTAPLSAVFILSVEVAFSTYLLKVALCDMESVTPTVVLFNSDVATVEHMRKSTGLPILDLQMSGNITADKLRVVLSEVMDKLLMSKPSETTYLCVVEKCVATESLSSEEQLPILLPSSLEQLERLGEDLMHRASCSLEEMCTKTPRASHVREVHPVFIVPGLQEPAKSAAEVLARNLMCPAIVIHLPGTAHSLKDNVAAVVSNMRRVQAEGPYNLVGVSWGGMYAVELARQLQAAGDKTQVFLLEGAPQTNQDVARLLGEGAQLQVYLLIRLLGLTASSVHKDLMLLPDWRSRLHRALSELPQTRTTNQQHLCLAVEAVYRRVETLLSYKPTGASLSGQVVLIRPNTQPDDTCGLEKLFKESLSVVLVEADHKSLLASSQVADVISKHSIINPYWIRHSDQSNVTEEQF
ncbi:fatty acid synthase-like isoform X1 [Bacillus rossius redtenbacheri]|uniref:fatty acid synthase-like isoform X1 n=1 Tax=Bacillus rossius redtenbacheri TaxID=93214 RepID=UPI002FDDBDB1